jgi:hypothetical protein
MHVADPTLLLLTLEQAGICFPGCTNVVLSILNVFTTVVLFFKMKIG